MNGFSAKSVVDFNRAGPGEAQLTLQEMIELYTWDDSKKGKFPFSFS
jgi:hypothetical protein